MSWVLFIDESGQDGRESPYEVLAGIAVEDRNVWPLIRQLSDAQESLFGLRLFEAYGREAKAQKLLKRKVFAHARQMPPLDPGIRTLRAREILENGADISRERLTALAQAKIAYCERTLRLCRNYDARAFASIVPRRAPRPPQSTQLRKDYSYLFERFFYFLNAQDGDPMGFLVFDEIERSASQILLNQVSEYFIRTRKGRTRSRLVVPEPLFVHSDLTTMVQMADLIAYVVSWGVRLTGMREAKRPELDPLAALVMRLRFRQETEGGRAHYGFKLIEDLRPADDRPHT